MQKISKLILATNNFGTLYGMCNYETEKTVSVSRLEINCMLSYQWHEAGTLWQLEDYVCEETRKELHAVV